MRTINDAQWKMSKKYSFIIPIYLSNKHLIDRAFVCRCGWIWIYVFDVYIVTNEIWYFHLLFVRIWRRSHKTKFFPFKWAFCFLTLSILSLLRNSIDCGESILWKCWRINVNMIKRKIQINEWLMRCVYNIFGSFVLFVCFCAQISISDSFNESIWGRKKKKILFTSPLLQFLIFGLR